MLTSELKDAILSFVDRRMSSTELEEWLVPRLPHYLQALDTVDADVVAAIELAFAEMNAGIRTEAEIRNDLNAIVQPLVPIAAQNSR